jgi:ADP-dependent NAD(P)H-hydrate dehydratase / NAD(P)H-hydrate epimerase
LPRLLATGVPTVLDATALVGDEAWFVAVREHGKCVLTPHTGEAAPLLGLSAKEIGRQPLEAAMTLAEKTNAVVVLKGRPTVIASGGRVAVSPSGNAGMASGGTGDVLAGLLGAWLEEDSLFERACAAVYAHGLAGDLAYGAYGNGLIAGDLIERFSRAWLELA